MTYEAINAIKSRLIGRLARVIRARALATGEWCWTIPVMACVSGVDIEEIRWLFDTSRHDVAGPFVFHRPNGVVFYEASSVKSGPKVGSHHRSTDGV